MKKVKKLTIILIIVLLCLVSFIGIYIEQHGVMKNIVRDYDLGMNLGAYRQVRLSAKDLENEQTSENTEDTENTENTENAENTENVENTESEQTSEETQKINDKVEQVKKLLEKRLKDLGAQDYLIKADYVTGDIVIELEETNRTDRIVADIYSTGTFKLVDSENKDDVLMTNDDLEKVSLLYSTTTSGTGIYLNLQFTKEGAEKIKDLSSNRYKTIEKTEEENAENQDETTETQEQTNEDGTDTNSSDESSEEVVQPKMTLIIDDTELLSSSFDNPISNGTLQLSLNAVTTDSTKIQEAVNTGLALSGILNNGPLPIEYTLEDNTYIYSDITENVKMVFVIAIAIIIIIALLILVVKYKMPALLAGISYIGFVALYVLTLRYANITVTLESVAGILIVLIINYLLITKILTKTTMINAFKEMALQSIPVIIVIIVFSFVKWTGLASFGMTMFWGLLLTIVYHFIVTNALLEK